MNNSITLPSKEEKIKKLPLIELSRPKSLQEIFLPEEVKQDLKDLVKTPLLMPHLILVGTPGVGKTSLARIIAHQVLGETTEFNYLEINASVDRGIQIIREKLREFISHTGFMKLGAPKSPYKIVFLDEACSLTGDAQLALRNLLQTYIGKARFIFSANDYYKIHEALKSRCKTIVFQKPTQQEMKSTISKILLKNNITYDKNNLEDLCENSNGDFRKVYNYLSPKI